MTIPGARHIDPDAEAERIAIGAASGPLMTAAAMQAARDALWHNPPPLAADCEHDLLCLLVIEVRQTVLCRKCGGLDADASRRVLTEPGRFISGEGGAPVRLLESGLRVTYEENHDHDHP